MKKNNGFIATSLLYSFFLLFCAILLGLIGTFLHNRTLHNNTIDNIKESLSNVGNITLAEAEVGSYVKIPIFTSGITISIENINWIVASNNSDNTITLVSDTIVMMTNSINDNSVLQEEINRFYNLFTTGSTSKNYMTYFTKVLIDDFENIEDILLKKSLLSNNEEYFYYDNNTNSFYLYQYSCDINDYCEVKKRVKIETGDTEQYGLRIVMTVPKSTPIASGIGVLNNPYQALYYAQEKSLVLHYDNLNNSGNKGFNLSSNYLKDLSGTNLDGYLDSGNYLNNQRNGITISASRTINSNLNIYNLINSSSGYTIEFKAKNYLRLSSSPNYLTNFIMLNNNSSLRVYTTNNPTGLSTNSFNTISIVKRPDSTNTDIYINGEFLKTTPNLLSSSGNVLYIGGSAYSEIFKSVRVYNSALTEAEVIHNYNMDMRWNNE